MDEYQDCDINQHKLICKLADILPCRIVGDPLQGIFDFGNSQIVDWANVFDYFERLPDLTIPYRWEKSNPKLGERLKELRQILYDKQQIPFKNVQDASDENIMRFLLSEKFNDDKVYVICDPKKEHYPHYLAKSLNNKFRTIEPLTSKDLCNYAKNIEGCCTVERLNKVIEFARKCLTEISGDCKRILNYKRGDLTERQTILKRYFHKICDSDKLQYVHDLFLFFEKEYNPTYKRYQLWQEMKKGLYETTIGEHVSLEKAVWHVRNQLRFNENRIPKRCISRTVLLKGLECDHAIIIKPELFDAKNLYVALTRASSKLTIISNCQSWSNYD